MTADKKTKETKHKPNKDSGELDKLRQELELANEARLRITADYANFQRRAAEERQLLTKKVESETLEQLIPVLDNLYRASSHAPTIPVDANMSELSEEDFKRIRTYFEGLQLIAKQLESVLSDAGLKRILTKGDPFNANLHEAISYEENANVPEDHIIDEIESGWQLDGKVVRPAKVRVSKG